MPASRSQPFNLRKQASTRHDLSVAAAAGESVDPWAEVYTQRPPAASGSASSIYSSVYGPIKETVEVPDVKPADMDAQKFTLDPSVAFWRDYSPAIVDDKAPLPEQLRWLTGVHAASPHTLPARVLPPCLESLWRWLRNEARKPHSELFCLSLVASIMACVYSGFYIHNVSCVLYCSRLLSESQLSRGAEYPGGPAGERHLQQQPERRILGVPHRPLRFLHGAGPLRCRLRRPPKASMQLQLSAMYTSDERVNPELR